MTLFPDRGTIERATRELALEPGLAAALVASARPTIWLQRSEPVADADLPPGASKVGGEPDLPPGLAWPERPPLDAVQAAEAARGLAAVGEWEAKARVQADLGRAVPLAFLAQIDLAAMAAAPGFDPALPDRGHLWAFHDVHAALTGPLPPDGGIRLLWSEAGGLARRATPQAVREAYALGIADFGFPASEPWGASMLAEPLSPVSGWTVSPRLDRAAYHALEDERFQMEDAGGDQLGGWEVPIQRSMQGEAELMATGADPRDADWGHAPAVLRAGERWRHVLTVDGETYLERLMTTWGDGSMYMFAEEGALAGRDLGRAVGVSQMT